MIIVHEIINSGWRGIRRALVFHIEIKYNMHDMRTPVVITSVFIISRGAYRLGIKANGANKIVISNTINETFSNLFVISGYYTTRVLLVR
ncbi:MAG: hypothetical protein Q7S72_01765 [Candidatus Taylorbacteria bacterium]|nr:hypothetical protein [Candidatus Taylorbacteria bacterium]